MATTQDAAPSVQPVRPTSPTTVKSPDSETAAIALSLAGKRRRSLGSFLHGSRRPSLPPQNKGKGHGRAEEAAADRDGRLSEDEEEEEEEGATRVGTIDIEAYNASKGKETAIVAVDEGIRRDVNPEEREIDFQPEYVWDVLFENQRGIYLMGKGYFSSRTLLPADPSPFTRPSKSIPSASSMSIMEPSKAKSRRITTQTTAAIAGTPTASTSTNANAGSSQAAGPSSDNQTTAHASEAQPRDEDGKVKERSRSNKTSYTLETYQPPLPDWEYLTPWMVNMRVGTDEAGWRYNAWFKKSGWSSHAGPVGWGGWVRRREWVRLRFLAPKEQKGAGLPDLAARQTFESPARSLSEAMSSETVEDNVQNILRTMAKIGLDRQRLETWSKWLHMAARDRESQTWKRLELLCNDEHAVREMIQFPPHMPFTHHAYVAKATD
ncbi:hypothetical protein I316_01386 [Kwoniella heveanensis BCC8398]|uniref:Peroxin domain-containing protein n=1 Tax=Kwoniella heveanensis BCC8398 TaxID=1296120 RepID=A0A1B9H0L2_9TREE|nr:hypothetical protein I316_01386 [Kwoniella heveanensis BCC8398]